MEFNPPPSTPKSIICYLLREFYRLGWCTGSGGGISLRENDHLFLAPSGVHKEFVMEDDIFETDLDGKVRVPPKNEGLKISECTPLFLQAYKLRNAGAVLHSHSINAILITNLFDGEFHCTNLEMIKGIKGHKNTDWCRIPIIKNTEFEPELTERLKNAVIAYPNAYAVLVENHGVYIWGDTWQKAKIHAECYEYLFKAVVKLHKIGIKIPRTLAPSRSSLRSWYLCESSQSDIREDQQGAQVKWVFEEDLKKIGLLAFKLDGNEKNEELERICKERNYKNRDQVKCGAEHCADYLAMIAKFKIEHLHADEEIRYILNGSGYFDVRDFQDRWIRIQVVKGDLLVLPEGIYHRFVPDISNFIHAMRLFNEEPKWTPIDRPNDEHPSRIKYLENLKKGQFN